MTLALLIVACVLAGVRAAHGQKPERGRDLGIPFEGTTGPLNAITDVGGVEVGHRTLVAGSCKVVVGEGAVRRGLTAVFPHGKDSGDPVVAGWVPTSGDGSV